MTQNAAAKTTMQTLWSGIQCKCPRCGQGKILKSYLKPVDSCPVCFEDLSKIRADDAPPWLTIFITGHIIGPIILYCAEHNLFDDWVVPSLVIGFALLCCFLILPLSKGFFIAAIWLSRQKKTEQPDN